MMDIEQVARVVDRVERSQVAAVTITDNDYTIKVINNLTQDSQINPINASTTDNQDNKSTDDLQVCAPYVGRVYLSADGAMDNLVSVGDDITVGQTVAYIDELTRLHPIVSETAGTIKQVLVNDGAWVEYGHPIFIL